MNIAEYDNLVRSIGEQRLRFLSTPGYRMHRGTEWVAMYVPQFNQIWTNPFVPKSVKDKALVEEFCHNNSSRAKPMQLLPIVNWLTGDSVRPDTNEFRDIAEAIVVAMRPLATGAHVDKRHLPRGGEYRHLGCQIIDLAKEFARFADEHVDEIEALREALWAIITCLLCIIPQRSGQCPAILDSMKRVQLSEQWRGGHHLLNLLIGGMAQQVPGNVAGELSFTIKRPNDPHMIISNLLDIMGCINPDNYTLDVVSAMFPTCLYLLTLGNSALLPIYWLKKQKNEIGWAVEIWHETHEQLQSTEDTMDAVLSNSIWPPGCGARRSYHRVFQEVKKYCLLPTPFDPHGLFEEMLNLVPVILKEYFCDHHKESDCHYCRALFYNDARAMRQMRGLVSMPNSLTPLLIDASRHFRTWLQEGSIRQIDYYLMKDLGNTLPLRRIRVDPEIAQARRAQFPWLETMQDDESE